MELDFDKIYFDMDGVLADFDRGLRELCGMEPDPDRDQDFDAKSLMWERIRGVEHFFDKLAPMPGAVEAFRMLRERFGARCEILTGIPMEERGITTAGTDKLRWVRRELDEIVPVFIVKRAQKKLRAESNGMPCILVDDSPRTIQEWIDAGGIGILHTDMPGTIRKLKEIGALPEE